MIKKCQNIQYWPQGVSLATISKKSNKKIIQLLPPSLQSHLLLEVHSHLLLEGDVPHVEADLGPVLHGDTVPAEQLELLYLSISRIHIPTVH